MKSFTTGLLIFLQFVINAQNCNCDHTLSGIATNSFNLIIENPLNKLYKPGDTICIQADTISAIRFEGLEGSVDSPIVIINCGGAVVINESIHSALELRNCKFIELSGSGDPSVFYGINIIVVNDIII